MGVFILYFVLWKIVFVFEKCVDIEICESCSLKQSPKITSLLNVSSFTLFKNEISSLALHIVVGWLGGGGAIKTELK